MKGPSVEPIDLNFDQKWVGAFSQGDKKFFYLICNIIIVVKFYY